MQFFVPDPADPAQAADPAKAERLYASIKAFAVSQSEAVQERRIYGLAYRHNGNQYNVKVGDVHPFNGELVIAIFCQERPSGCYLICTAHRGVVRRGPILVDDDWETHSWDFE
jgi:hypothetical protein